MYMSIDEVLYSPIGNPNDPDRLSQNPLLQEINAELGNYLENYLFELNNPQTRHSVEAGLESYFSGLMSEGAIYDFLVVCDESNNSPQTIENRELIVDVFVKPMRSVECIHFRPWIG